MKPFLRRWLRPITNKNAAPGRRSRRTVLTVDGLEDRTTPATFTVTNVLDTGTGSLRDAMTLANTTPNAAESRHHHVRPGVLFVARTINLAPPPADHHRERDDQRTGGDLFSPLIGLPPTWQLTVQRSTGTFAIINVAATGVTTVNLTGFKITNGVSPVAALGGGGIFIPATAAT